MEGERGREGESDNKTEREKERGGGGLERGRDIAGERN